MNVVPLAVGVVLALAAHADAMCGNPAWNGTKSTTVPTRGTLYVYDESLNPYYPWDTRDFLIADGLRFADSRNPTEDQLLVDDLLMTETAMLEKARERGQFQQATLWLRGYGIVEQTLVSPTVVRIDFAGQPGSTLIVNDTVYQLDDAWRSPTHAPRASKYWQQLYAWSCSEHDALHVEFDQVTAAVRARWHYRGATREWIVPAPGTKASSVLMLGQIDCGGTTLAPDELAAGGRLELFAIRLDGGEAPILGIPTWISSAMLEVRGTKRDAFALDQKAAERQTWWALAHAAVWGLLLLVGSRALVSGVRS